MRYLGGKTMSNHNPRFDQEWDDLIKRDKCPDCGKSKSAKGFIGGCVCKEESQFSQRQ